MKVFILLCLLHSDFVQGFFGGWNPFNNPEAYNACRDNQGSCGCCKIIREVERLRNYTIWSLDELENEAQKVNKSFSDLKKSYTAFSGAISTDGFNECKGPLREKKVLTYNHTYINMNNGYDLSTGIFTAPYSGVYSIAFTVYSDAGAEGSPIAACAVLEVNQTPITRTSDINSDDQEDQAAHVVALELQKGDQVTVCLPAGCFVCDKTSRYNTFSVFLLYATE